MFSGVRIVHIGACVRLLGIVFHLVVILSEQVALLKCRSALRNSYQGYVLGESALGGHARGAFLSAQSASKTTK
jgi:hypothetical protein